MPGLDDQDRRHELRCVGADDLAQRIKGGFMDIWRIKDDKLAADTKACAACGRS